MTERVLFLPADLGFDRHWGLSRFEQDSEIKFAPFGQSLFVIDPHSRTRQVESEHSEARTFPFDLHLHYQDPL